MSFTPLGSRWPILILALISLMIGSYAKDLFLQVPLDYRTADMLPIIQIMGERLLDGQPVYNIIPEIWGGMQPIYLPALWMAYVPGAIMGIDVRWVSIAAFVLALSIIYSSWIRSIYREQLVTLIPAALLIYAIISIDSSLITMTEEPVVLLYYTALGWSMIYKRWRLFGVMAALCLLSRYALAPWLVIFGIILMIQHRSAFLSATITGTVVLLGLMMVSGAMAHLDMFMSLESSYLNDIQSNRAKYEDMIDSGLGIAKFYNYQNLAGLHTLMKTMAIITPTLLGLWYIWRRHHIDLSSFGLASLKICLVLFYNLIIMPYSYLFYTSTMMSLLIVTYCYRKRPPAEEGGLGLFSELKKLNPNSITS